MIKIKLVDNTRQISSIISVSFQIISLLVVVLEQTLACYQITI